MSEEIEEHRLHLQNLIISLWRATSILGNSLRCLGDFHGALLASDLSGCNKLEVSLDGIRCLVGPLSPSLFGDSIYISSCMYIITPFIFLSQAYII